MMVCPFEVTPDMVCPVTGKTLAEMSPDALRALAGEGVPLWSEAAAEEYEARRDFSYFPPALLDDDEAFQ